METLQLPLPLPAPVDPADVATWPEVCLAEVWQPVTPKRPQGLIPTYRRRLFAAQDWETIYDKVDRCSRYAYGSRPVAVTKYRTCGLQLPLLLEAVALGVALPRLYVLDGMLKPHQLRSDKPRGSLPLLGQSGTWVGRNWNRIRQIWQQQDTDGLRGLGLIDCGHERFAVQLVPDNCMHTGRREWALDLGKQASSDTAAASAFLDMPIVTEAQIVARVIKPYRAHYRLNRGLLEKLRLHAHKDAFAPRVPVKGQTPDCSRPHYNWLVVLPGRTPEPS